MRLRHLPFLLLLLALGRARAEAAPEEPLRAGVGTADLEPERAEDGGRARAVVFEQGTLRVALVAVDLPAVPEDLREAVLLEARPLGLTDVLLVATRAATALRGWSAAPLLRPVTGPLVPEQRQALARRIAAALGAACDARAPARLLRAQAAPDRVGLLARERTLRVADDQGRERALLLHVESADVEGEGLSTSRWPSLAARRWEAARSGVPALLLPLPAASPGTAPGAQDAPAAARARADRVLERVRAFVPVPQPATVTLATRPRRVWLPTVAGQLLRPQESAPHGMLRVPALSSELRLGPLTLRTVPGRVLEGSALDALDAGPDRWLLSHAQDHLGLLSAAPLDASADAYLCGDVAALLSGDAGEATTPAPPPAEGDDDAVVVLRAPPAPAGEPPEGRALGRVHGARLRRAIEAFTSDALPFLCAPGDGSAVAALAGQSEADALGVPRAAVRLLHLVQEARAAARLHLDAQTLAEVQGIAEGSGVPLDALWIVNLLLDGAWTAVATPGGRAPVADGTALCVGRECTSMGQWLHGATWSSTLAPLLRRHVRVLVVEPATDHPFAAVGLPGVVGVSQGLNARGLSFSCERVASGQDLGFSGPPPALLMRRALQQADDIEEAERLLRQAPLEVGARFSVLDGRRGEARVIERWGARAQARGAVDGVLLQRDPDASVECFLGACDPEIPRGPDAARGYPLLRALMEQVQGRVRAPLLAQALLQPGVAGDSALASVVMEPALMRLLVADAGDAAEVPGMDAWRTVDLGALLSPSRRRAYAPPWLVTDVGQVTTRPSATRIGEVTLTDVTLDSPAPSGHAQNDVIHGVYYRPAVVKGSVIALPAWKESTLAGQGMLALRLAQDGYAVLVMPLPWQVDRAPKGVGSGAWTLSADIARTRAAFLQGAADVARASLWLERSEGIPPKRQGVMGVSLGGHVAALAYGAYPERFAAGCFVLAGGALERAMLQANRLTGRIRAELLARGVTPAEGRTLVGDVDGATWADPARRAGVLIVGADQDDVVAPESVRALAAAYQGARTEWIHGDHMAILGNLKRVLDWVVGHLDATLGKAEGGG